MPRLRTKYNVLFGLVILLIGSAACTQKVNKEVEIPTDLIHRDTMVSIFVDLRLMDAVANFEQKKGNRKLDKVNYYLHNSIIIKYNITREQFERSYTYYQSDLKVIDGIYADAITRLSVIKTITEQEDHGLE